MLEQRQTANRPDAAQSVAARSGRRQAVYFYFILFTLALVMIAAAFTSVRAYADDESGDVTEPFAVTVENEDSPSGEHIFGSSFGIEGVVKSNRPMAKVFGGIYTAEGDRVIYHEVEPNSTSCNLYSSFDTVLTFGSLPLGDYVYMFEAADSDGQTVTAVRTEFSVVYGDIPSEISVSGLSLPADSLPKGCSFSLRGIITSSYRLAKVWGGVYNADGTKTDVYYEDAPNTAMYDLYHTFDDHLTFRNLPAGSYIYKIEATDLRGATQTVAEKSFAIVDDESAPSDIRLYGASYPTGTLAEGAGFSIKGAIFSTYNLLSITGGIYKAEDSSCDYDDRYVATIPVNAKSFNLSTLDPNIRFGSLPVGEYVYKIIATDEKGYSVELINSTFEIRSAERTESSPPVVMKGMDVSVYQGDIDFAKAFDDGIDFVILRAGVTYNSDANYRQDANFEKYFASADNAGMKIGVYLYTSAINRSEMEADITGLLKTLEGKDFDMPVYIDVEASRQSSLGKAALTDLVKYGCELLAENGYKAGVYASYSWYRDYIDLGTFRDAGSEIWLAIWPDEAPENYDLSDFCVTWQYSSEGRVDGIGGNVDLDFRYLPLSDENHSVVIAPSEGGSIVSNKDDAGFGERVTVTVTPDDGYELISVIFNGIERASNGRGVYSFLMPNSDALVTAVFRNLNDTPDGENSGTDSESGTDVTPDAPANGSSGGGSSPLSPDTGDDGVDMYIALAVLSAAASLYALIRRRRMGA